MATEVLSYGGYYFSAAIETPLTAATPAKALGTTTSGSLLAFTHTGNRLTFTGLIPRTFAIMATCSISSSGATNSKVHFYKNGSPLAGATIERKVTTGGDIGAIAVMGIASLSTNDYVEMWLETDDGNSLTIEYGCVATMVLG